MESDVQEIERTRLRFPSQFSTIEDVFAFSYDAMVDALGRFDPEVDIVDLLDDLHGFLSKEPDESGDVAAVLDLVQAEMEIMAFSRSSRCSIIHL